MKPAVLLIDLGNTRLKWALAVDGVLSTPVQAIAWPAAALPLAGWRQAPIAAIGLASVAPAEVTQSLVDALRPVAATVYRPATTAAWQGLRCAYAEPARLGIDRWLALIAAYSRDASRAYTLVSAGTALTVDRLDADGRHRGGVIAPGLAAMRDGLTAAAPGLAGLGTGDAGPGLARDSADAIASGCLQAALGVIERHRHDEAGAPSSLILTGGDAPVLAPHLGDAVQVEPALVLEGLANWMRVANPGPDAR